VVHTILVWRAWCLLPANSNKTSVIQIQQTLVNYVNWGPGVTETTIRKYNCIAEQASSELPTCGTNVENDPSYLCFEQVGQTICSRGAYDPCTDNSIPNSYHPASFAKVYFCIDNPTNSQCCPLGTHFVSLGGAKSETSSGGPVRFR